MDIQQIDNTIGEYNTLRRKLIDLSHDRLMPANKNAMARRHELNHLDLDGFYVEDGKVIVEFSYREPYSGNEVVEFTQSELEGTMSKRTNRQKDRRHVRRVLNRASEFFKNVGHGRSIRKGYGGGLTKTNLLDRSVEA